MNIKHILFAGALTAFSLAACNQEEKPVATLEDSLYHIEDSASDPVQHLRYTFFQKYQTYLITEPRTIDYQFNFQRKNNLRITPPEQSAQRIQAGAALLEEVFLQHYPEAFKQQNLPFSILLADSILFLGHMEKIPSYHAYATGRFLALAGIRPGMEQYTPQQKNDIRGDINSRYWVDYLGGYKNKFVVPEAFYQISEGYFAKSADAIKELGDVTDMQPDEIDFYPLGFTGYSPLTTFYDEQYEAWWIETPSPDMDLRLWVSFLFTTPKAERDRIIETYPLMKQKYDLLKEAFMQCDGFDIEQLP